MKENSVVFLDYPGIPMPGAGGYDKSDNVLQEIARAEEKQRFVQANADELEAELSELNRRDFSGSRWGKRRELTLGWLNGLYRDAKVGDLIVVPSPGIIRSEEGEWEKAYTLVGEIIGEPERWTNGAPRNLGLGRYVVRRVRWLAQVNELELDPKIVPTLRTQNALVKMHARSFERVLGAAYTNIVLEGEFLARFVTSNAEFTAFENFHFNAFVMSAVAACRARTLQASREAFETNRSIYDIAAEVQREDDLVPDLESNIHSPGYMTLRGSPLIPAIVSALFALALDANADPFAGEGPDQVEVVNTESHAFDPCDVGIDEAVRDAIRIMGYDRWQQACAAARKSNDNEGLQSITTINSDAN